MNHARPTSLLRRRSLIGLCAAIAWGACATDESGAGGGLDGAPPALDVRLVVDPNQTTPADLARRLTSIVVIVDAEGGLYDPGEETSNGLVQIKNADADPTDLEIVATLEVDRDSLPTFRLERGGLDDVPIDLRVLGFAEGGSTHIAEGTLRAARFGDAPRDVSLPFLLRASELPPRVVDVLPADGASVAGCTIPSVTLVFSRPIDAESLVAAGAIDLAPFGPPTSIELDDSGLVATLVTTGLEGTDESGITFRLVVSGAIRAADGGPGLDQAPAEGGAQVFEADVHLACSPPPLQPCTPGDPAPGCSNGCGEVACTPDPRIQCVDESCVLAGCLTSCPEGTVCNAARTECALDCRTADAIDGCAPPSSCDASSGSCVDAASATD